MILGYEIHVRTDHLPLFRFLQDKHLQGRLSRWCMTMQEFGPHFHIKEKENVVADALNRNSPNKAATTTDVNALSPPLPSYSPQQLQTEQKSDHTLGQIIKDLEEKH